MQISIIRELYDLKLRLNVSEATKNISYPRGENAVDGNTETRWLRKFRLGCKNLEDWAKSGSLMSVDAEFLFQAIETNSASSTRRVSGNLGICHYNEVRYFHDIGKVIQNSWIVPNVTNVLQNILLTLVFKGNQVINSGNLKKK